MNGLEFFVFDQRILDADLQTASPHLGEPAHDPTPCDAHRQRPARDDRLRPRKNQGDRFIPLRTNISGMPRGGIWLDKENAAEKANQQPGPSEENYKCKKRLFKFNFENSPGDKNDELLQDMAVKGLLKISRVEKKASRAPKKAEQVLDAPGLINDYYLNLIDWGKKNLLAVCLGEGAFVWNPASQEGRQFFTSDNSLMAGVTKNDNQIAVGFSTSQVQVRDFERDAVVREVDDHWARVSAISWNPSFGSVFSTSSKDCEIINYDMRCSRSINVFRGHTQEVCGLKWSPDGGLLASGGNDNCLMIWDPRKTAGPLHQFSEHKAAVKALAWCPWQKNLIVSGGGSEDKTIKYWRVDEGKLLSSHKISSQVCSLLWNPNERELLSAHGYSQYQLTLWKYPSMEICSEFFGHKDRVLHLALSPDCSTVVSAGGDETLRFWKVFDSSRDINAAFAQKSALTPLSIR